MYHYSLCVVCNEDLEKVEVEIKVQDNKTVPKNENINIAEENGSSVIWLIDTRMAGIGVENLVYNGSKDSS